MSAPVVERRSTASPVREAGARRSGTLAPPRIPAQRTAAAERLTGRERASRQRAQEHAGRAKFVLVVMTLLVVGLVATLWLSTAAAADSYRLQEARTRAGSLTEQSETLRKQVTAMNSPAALAERATAQGLVPVQDTARLVVAPDGRVDVVGEPTAARAGAGSAPRIPVGQAPREQTPAAQSPPAGETPAGESPAAALPPAAQAFAPSVPQADTADPAAADGATTTGGTATSAGGNG